jgi:hypothetical protein
VTTDQARNLASELIVWVALLGAFGVLAAIHILDGRRRRRRVVEICATGAYGPRAEVVRAIVARAGLLEPDEAARLDAARSVALERDPRRRKPPAAARRARDRAFANERDVVALAAATGARSAALAALATLPDPTLRREAAECAAETAAAVVAVDRIPAVEFRALTRAWREVIGPIAVRPRREA